MGRPKLPDGDGLQANLQVRMRAVDIDTLRRQAVRGNQSLSEMIRDLLEHFAQDLRNEEAEGEGT